MLLVPRQQCRHHDAGGGAQISVAVRVIPDVRGKVFLVGRTAVLVAIFRPLGIHRRAAIGRTNGDATETRLQGLQQLFTQLPPCLDGFVGVIRNIGDALDLTDFRVQEITHEKVLRQPYPSQLFQRLHRDRPVHSPASSRANARIRNSDSGASDGAASVRERQPSTQPIGCPMHRSKIRTNAP
ncbi:hypothetical protein FQZ97_1067980 [compost metagenome]